ncbi:MAG: ROK family protein [Candidatus Pedobacter colombiensis]|uniref:ROK family protein n=1 Tax=Candidatus Pedobacter colombiensis TaxID=3121371 RepID=A0AAJ5W5Y9_9SPHI|nr:ROK family protein [Pedobacter sp.]WEK17728.1 MAG: ROK family protein [Pedobacter sp.]
MTKSYAIGIDVGGSSLKCGLVSNTGEVVYSFLFPLNNVLTEGEVIALINAAIRKCVEYAPEKVIGVGIGFPGIVDQNVVIGGADNLPGFENLDLGKIIAASTSLNVVIDNDANMMGWGELVYGAAGDCTDVVFITIGTGIGGGLIIDGKLYGGYKNRGTELGHITIQHNGIKCSCGSSGCFEAYASVSALINDYAVLHDTDTEGITGKMIVENYLAREQEAVSAMQKHFDYMATGIASYINVFSPQKVVLGGGITEAGKFYIEEIKSRVMERVMPGTSQYTHIVAAKLGNQAGLLGCAARVFSKF